jgi:hypothetical protein
MTPTRPLTPDEEAAARIREAVERARQRLGPRLSESTRTNHRLLNRLESHLGCVVCRGPLTDGVCAPCGAAWPK